jgi:threonine/homoserine/homoserine lactone efflux protein
MTLVNPMTLAFWFVAVPGTVGHIAGNPRSELPIICLGVALGTSLWVVFFSGVMSALGRRYRRRWWLVAADVLGGIMLLGFAVWTFIHQPHPYNAPQSSRVELHWAHDWAHA